MLMDSPMAVSNFTASAVDEIPSDYVHKYIDLVFDELRQEVLASPRLSSSDRTWFEREANNLQVKCKEILGAKNNRLKDAALRAVASALCLSFYYAVGSQATREFRFVQTEAAREKRMRRTQPYKAIVDEEARKLWARREKFANNPHGTAHTIYPAVAAKVELMPSKPKWWLPREATKTRAAETDEEAKLRRIGAIGKRIARSKRVDH